MQEKAIEVLSRLCRDQPVVLGDLIVATPKAIVALTEYVVASTRTEVKVGGTALLICAFKEHRQQAMEELNQSGSFGPLIQSLIKMLDMEALDHSNKNEMQNGFHAKSKDMSNDNQLEDFRVPLDHDPAAMLGGTAALWLLSIIASHNDENKVAIMEGGAIELLTEKLASVVSSTAQVIFNAVPFSPAY